MIEKLEEINHRFEEVGQLLGQPDTMKDMKRFSQLSKEYRDLEKIVLKYNQLKEVLLNISDKPMLNQKDLLDEKFESWRGNLEQVDDVCVIGVRI